MISKGELNFSNPDHSSANICCISFAAHMGLPFKLSLPEIKEDTMCYPRLLTHEVQDIVYAAGYNISAKKCWYRFPNELCNFTGSKFHQWWMRNMPHYGTVVTVTRASDAENLQRYLGDKAPAYIPT
jgi:hypothetical protein